MKRVYDTSPQPFMACFIYMKRKLFLRRERIKITKEWNGDCQWTVFHGSPLGARVERETTFAMVDEYERGWWLCGGEKARLKLCPAQNHYEMSAQYSVPGTQLVQLRP
jgi:hypothetical protein